MVAITVDHIPFNTAFNRRPGNAMKPTAITIHSTGNETSNASGERKWLVNPDNKRQASWHYVVDQSICIEAVPANERAWHAGDGLGQGNTASIGIEMVHSGDRAKVLQRTKELTVQLMIKHGITKVVRHYDWTRKNCPAILNADGKWTAWAKFHAEIMAMYKAATEKPEIVQVSNPVKPPAAAVKNYLIAGDSGQAVKDLQNLLVKAGHKVAIDGSYGPATEKAVKAFQTAAKIEVDGIAGPGTMAALKAYKKPVAAKAAAKPAAIKSIGSIQIVNVAKACYILDKASTKGKVLATINKGGTIQISGSVPGWFEVIYNGRRAYINEKYGKRV